MLLKNQSFIKLEPLRIENWLPHNPYTPFVHFNSLFNFHFNSLFNFHFNSLL